MKTLRFLILGLLATTVIGRAQITGPGWYNGTQRDPAAYSRPDNSSGSPQQTTPPAMSPPMMMHDLLSQQSPTNIAEAITPGIQALADGMQDNPLTIFKYVHDHIRYVLYYGSKKGAELTLLEKSGNDFDQSALLVALLRAAGYNATYEFGWMEVPYDATDGSHNDLHHWLQLGLANTNWDYTSNYLWSLFWNTRGYPTVDYLSRYQADTNTFLFQRVWVTVTINSTNYFLDPAFKVSEPRASIINLASATGASSNALMTAAAGTDAGNYVTNLDEAALRSTLTGYATSLSGYLQSNYPNFNAQEVLGGWQITAATNTSLPMNTIFESVDYPQYPAMNVTNWINEPTNLMATLKITFAGTNHQFFMPQLEGQRLSLTFDTNGTAELWQDDTPLAQHATGGSSRTTNVVLNVNQPFGDWNFTNNTLMPDTFADLTVTNSYQRTNATYALTYAFEPDWGWLQERQNQLDNYLLQGLPDTSRQVVSETLNIMGLNWMLQTESAGHLVEPQLGILPQFHCRLGRMAQEGGHGYYVDVYMQLAGFLSNAGWDAANEDKEGRDFDLFTYFGSALENGLIEQLQNTNIVGASTVKMLEVANADGQAVYLASSTNWTSGADVSGRLVNYSSATKTALGNLISQGYYLLLPQNGSNQVAGAGSWAGYGYVGHLNVTNSEAVTAFTISGGYNGGYSSSPTAPVNTAYVDSSGQSQPAYFALTPASTPAPTAADPVDTADGTFQVEHTDLSLGQAEPCGITLSRYYNGTRRFSNPAGMAGGWIHNYSVNANTVAAPQAGLGDATAAQAVAMLATTCAAINLYNAAQPDSKNWLVTALIAKWGVDQLTKNGVSVNLGKDTVQFVQQPNGVFAPPANCNMSLTQSGSGYSLQERHGNTFNFTPPGLLSTIVDQYGNTLSLAYNASNWVQSVTDWKGRYLTFNYTGGRLTSVADSAGRSVYYGYSTAFNPQGDLASFTDPEGQTSTYTYDTNHQITATFDAQARLVVSNLYDNQGHVATQYTEGSTNQTWRIYWSGWQTIEQDPAGSQRIFSYDDYGRLVGLQDQLGNLAQIAYDGLNHILWTISPLGAVNSHEYDGNNNIVYSIDPLHDWTYFVHDSQNNLIATTDPRGDTSTFGYNAQFSLTGSTNGAGDYVNYMLRAAVLS